MSCDLAVWANVQPFMGLDPDDAYELLSDRLEDDAALTEPPAREIAEFIAALMSRWPAVGSPGGERSPWCMGPEIGDGAGPFIYITLTYSGAKTAVDEIAKIARERGLVCYDPQLEGVI